jgi:hypothetical protein
MITRLIGTYSIAFPLKFDSFAMAVASDGGTLSLSFEDALCVKHRLYIDRRIDTTTYDHFYQNAYPGSEKSICLGENKDVVNEIEAIITQKYH